MDRVKLAIESLQTHIDYDKRANGMQTGEITIGIAEAETIMELLKEQEAQKFFVDESGKITPLPIVFPNCPLKEYEAVVRCKDCKHQVDRGRRYKDCDKHFLQAKDDWFCADGERRTNDA